MNAITGKDYRPACGLCDLPPWEECECTALLPCRDPAPGSVDLVNAEADSRLQHVLSFD